MDITMKPSLEHSELIRPCPGQEVSGDTIFTRPVEQGFLVAIVDVLGHGPEAHELAVNIGAYLTRYATPDVCNVMNNLHQHLRGTRGAAMGLCSIDSAAHRLTYAGVGNTAMRRFGAEEVRLVSQDGVLGQNLRTPRPQSLPLESGDLIVLYTDGVSDRFTTRDYPSILTHSTREVTRNIVQRFGKGHDDAACVAVRYEK